MATRRINVPEKIDAEPEPQFSQSKRPHADRYLLQVDRQTKGSYPTEAAAQEAGMVIKRNHPVVCVTIYDSVETANMTVELPATSS